MPALAFCVQHGDVIENQEAEREYAKKINIVATGLVGTGDDSAIVLLCHDSPWHQVRMPDSAPVIFITTGKGQIEPIL
jgi:hypothetical protein